ncbi:MAG: zf-TFIIB domain-containing protein [Sandaracinus sp.]|nr:zf-TFIIB domain-containing protein [Sandaracinus sp.]
MRSCPRCHQPFTVQQDRGLEIDLCSRCGGVFLDPGETEARGVSLDRLFEVDPGAVKDLGASLRPCPSHGLPMRRLHVGSRVGAVEVERAPCCGGVFFDPGEESALAAAVRAAAAHPRPSYEDLVAKGFAPPPDLRPSAVPQPVGATQGLAGLAQGLAAASSAHAPTTVDESSRRCPRCSAPFQATKMDGAEIDVCPGCNGLFYDAGEIEERGVDLRGVFGDGPEAATVKGPSALACPIHGEKMTRVHVRWIGGIVEIDRSDACCGGMFFDEGEWEIFVRAARASLSEYADRVHRTSGEFAGEDAIMKQIAEGGAAVEASVTRGAMDRASQHMAFWSALRHLRRYGGYHGGGGYGGW